MGDEIVNERRWGRDVVGCDHSDRHDVLGSGNDRVGSHRDHWVEIASGQGVAQVAQIVSKERLDEREIGAQRRFQ